MNLVVSNQIEGYVTNLLSYFVLMFSQRRATLFLASPDEIQPFRLEPPKFASHKYIRHQDGFSLSFPLADEEGSAKSIFGFDRTKLPERLSQFDEVLQNTLGHSSFPLVFVGDKEMFEAFRAVTTQPLVVPELVHGDFEHAPRQKILRASLPIVERYSRKRMDESFAAVKKKRDQPLN